MGLIQREDDKIDELIKRKSRIYIIINTIAYLFRLVGKERRKRRQPETDSLSTEEVEYARNFLFRRIQNNVYRTVADGPFVPYPFLSFPCVYPEALA